MKIKIGISARHVHLSQRDLEILFGEGYELTKFKDLSQQGQYAANEQVIIKGERSQIEKVRILGPVRSQSQVEVAKTDAVKLGVNPPVRNSGDLKESAPITIIGPKGTVELEEGCIIATRHIHINNEDAEKYGLTGDDKVSVIIPGEKGGVMNNVSVKIDPSFALEMHIDTDDANAFLIPSGCEFEVVKNIENN